MDPDTGGKGSARSKRARLVAPLALAATLLLWASAFPFIRVALEDFPPGQIALFRFTIATVLLGILVLIRSVVYGHGMRLPRVRDLPGIIVAGLVGIAAYPVLVGYGQIEVGSGAAAVLVDSAPIFTALFATLFLGERLSLRAWTGIVVAFVGIVLISVGEGGSLKFTPAVLILLVAAVALSGYIVLQRPYLPKYGAVPVAFYTVVAGTVALLWFLPGSITALQEASSKATLSVIYLGVFPSAVAYTTWAFVLSRLPASRASSFLYLIPPLTFILSWTLFGERAALLSVLGAAVTLAAVIVVNQRGDG